MTWDDFEKLPMGTIIDDGARAKYIKPEQAIDLHLDGLVIAISDGVLRNGRQVKAGKPVHVSRLNCFELTKETDNG